MRILLINPRTREYTKGVTVQAGAPLGILSIAAVLRQNGHNVKIYDRNIEENSIKEYMKFDPELIGFSSFTGPMLLDALKISKLFREYLEVPIVWGGIHASLLPIKTIQNAYIDMIVVGEGEETIVELAGGIEKGGDLGKIKGLIWKRKDNGSIKIIENEPRPFIRDLDELPFPAWDLVDEKQYFKTAIGLNRSSSAFFSIQSSRGCPFNCGFCYNTAFNRRKWRSKSPKRVLEEISFLREKYQIHKINFKDDNFTVNKNRAIEICKGLIKNKLDVRFNVDCRVDLFNRELVQYLKWGGCDQIYFGIESGSRRILKFINKEITVEQAVDAIKLSRKYKIKNSASFIMGFPTETSEDIYFTERLIHQMNPDNLLLKIYTPYPGTPLYNYLIERNLFIPPDKLEDWAVGWTYANLQLSNVPNPLLNRQMKHLTRKFYLKRLPFLALSFLNNVLKSQVSIPKLLSWTIKNFNN